MPCIIMRGLHGSTIFFHITSQTALFFKVIEHEMCVLIFFTTSV